MYGFFFNYNQPTRFDAVEVIGDEGGCDACGVGVTCLRSGRNQLSYLSKKGSAGWRLLRRYADQYCQRYPAADPSPGALRSPEMIVRRLLWGLGARYRLDSRELPRCPDILSRPKDIAFRVHECFWHLHGDYELAWLAGPCAIGV